MRKKIGIFSLLSFFAVSACLLACGEAKVAGGVSEETNTLAGLLQDEHGNPLSGVAVRAASLKSSSVYEDLTSNQGRFSMDVPNGIFAISAQRDSLAYYEIRKVVNDVSVNAVANPVDTVELVVEYSSRELARGATVNLIGSGYSDTLVEGRVKTVLPHGDLVILAGSPSVNYESAYFRVKNGSVVGPYATSISLDSLMNVEVPEERNGKDTLKFSLPAKRDYFALWKFTNVEHENIPRITYNGNTLFIYGNPLNGGVAEFTDASRFAVLESDNGAFDNVSRLNASVELVLNSLPSESAYRKNIFGKVGFGSEKDESAFSLALVKGECGVTSAKIGFFVADSASDFVTDCDHAVFADVDVLKKTLISASLDEGTLRIFKNGMLIAEKEIGEINIRKSSESIYIGKESVSMKVYSASLDTNRISETEAFFEYSKKGGL